MFQLLLISTDENGYQPLGIMTLRSALEAEISGVDCNIDMVDCSVQPIDISEKLKNYDAICISIPVFGALWRTLKLIKEIRMYTQTPIFVYNQYAAINEKLFDDFFSCYVIRGHYEFWLPQIIKNLLSDIDFSSILSLNKKASNAREAEFFIPSREYLPNLSHYKNFRGKIAANVEIMRGCIHKCLYCSVYACYNGRVREIPSDIVREDLEQVISQGAEHITFVDADHFSLGSRALQKLKELQSSLKGLSFDITARADCIVKYEELINEYKNIGCQEITVALEFPSDNVLRHINKIIKIEDIYKAIEILDKHNIDINPTFIAFSPWVSFQELQDISNFLEQTNLKDKVNPDQLKTRLLLYKGSPLLRRKHIHDVIVKEHETYYEWRHEDARVEQLYQDMGGQSDITKVKCCIKG